MKINSKSTWLSDASIALIEKKYNAKYIYETELQSDGPVGAIFYQENPPGNYSNWFALYYNLDKVLMITSAAEIIKTPVKAIKVGDDDWIYSHYTHHFCEKNGIAIDGGRSYTRLVGSNLKTLEEVNNFIPTKDGLVMA